MAFRFRLSSGAFSLPAGAASVDWNVLNGTDQPQPLRVSVFNWPIGARRVRLAPGPVELTLDPWTATHNANSVEPGFPIEVVVQVNDLKILPTVEVWQDLGGTVIAGTRIGPGDFVRT